MPQEKIKINLSWLRVSNLYLTMLVIYITVTKIQKKSNKTIYGTTQGPTF